MSLELLTENLTNPALLFFILGIVATYFKSDLEIPPNSSKFISLYLLFAIGFKGGQGLAESVWSMEIVWTVIFGLVMASVIPLYSYFILRMRFNVYDAAAVAAAYGSISAVTFVTAASFLEMQDATFGGHMVAVMALMEAPAIIVAVMLMHMPGQEGRSEKGDIRKAIHHSLTNGSVLLILGSLLIGMVANEQQSNGIKPFTTDIFNGFLAIFLLDMGILSGRKLGDFFKQGKFATLFAILMPLFNGVLVAFLSQYVTDDLGNRFMLAILASSASYIAVPAAMKIAAPQANPSLYLPMALAVTFPFNITIGMPIYWSLIAGW
jgi:hypothetical protein